MIATTTTTAGGAEQALGDMTGGRISHSKDQSAVIVTPSTTKAPQAAGSSSPLPGVARRSSLPVALTPSEEATCQASDTFPLVYPKGVAPPSLITPHPPILEDASRERLLARRCVTEDPVVQLCRVSWLFEGTASHVADGGKSFPKLLPFSMPAAASLGGKPNQTSRLIVPPEEEAELLADNLFFEAAAQFRCTISEDAKGRRRPPTVNGPSVTPLPPLLLDDAAAWIDPVDALAARNALEFYGDSTLRDVWDRVIHRWTPKGGNAATLSRKKRSSALLSGVENLKLILNQTMRGPVYANAVPIEYNWTASAIVATAEESLDAIVTTTTKSPASDGAREGARDDLSYPRSSASQRGYLRTSFRFDHTLEALRDEQHAIQPVPVVPFVRHSGGSDGSGTASTSYYVPRHASFPPVAHWRPDVAAAWCQFAGAAAAFSVDPHNLTNVSRVALLDRTPPRPELLDSKALTKPRQVDRDRQLARAAGPRAYHLWLNNHAHPKMLFVTLAVHFATRYASDTMDEWARRNPTTTAAADVQVTAAVNEEGEQSGGTTATTKPPLPAASGGGKPKDWTSMLVAQVMRRRRGEIALAQDADWQQHKLLEFTDAFWQYVESQLSQRSNVRAVFFIEVVMECPVMEDSSVPKNRFLKERAHLCWEINRFVRLMTGVVRLFAAEARRHAAVLEGRGGSVTSMVCETSADKMRSDSNSTGTGSAAPRRPPEPNVTKKWGGRAVQRRLCHWMRAAAGRTDATAAVPHRRIGAMVSRFAQRLVVLRALDCSFMRRPEAGEPVKGRPKESRGGCTKEGIHAGGHLVRLQGDALLGLAARVAACYDRG